MTTLTRAEDIHWETYPQQTERSVPRDVPPEAPPLDRSWLVMTTVPRAVPDGYVRLTLWKVLTLVEVVLMALLVSIISFLIVWVTLG